MVGKFHVNDSGLGSLWSKTVQLSGIARGNGERVRKYAFPPLGSAGTGIYIDIMQPGLKNTWDQAERFGGGTAEVVAHLAKNIDGARKLYSSGDRRASAGFDALIDDIGTPDKTVLAGRPKPDGRSKAEDLGCTWPEDPAIHDGAPQSNPGFKFEFNVSTGDLLKPTAYVRAALAKIWGEEDPIGFFLKPFLGDWDALYKSGVEFERYAKSFGRMGRALGFLSDQVPAVWDGQASQNAREQMIDLGQKIAKAEPEFAQAGKVFKTAANDAYDAYDYFSGKIADAIDLLVPIAGEVNAGRALSKEAAAIVTTVKNVHKTLTERSAKVESAYKVLKAFPESLSMPTPKINGYSVTIGGWWKSSKQGPF